MTHLPVKRIALAIALASSGLTSTAMALQPADYTGDELNVYFSGATATDNALESLMIAAVGGVCDDIASTTDSTIDIYRDPTTNRNQRVIFCNTRTGLTGITAGQQLAFHKESIGGSSNAITPIARSLQIPFFNMANAGANCGTRTFVPAANGLAAYWNWTCTPSEINLVPNGGLSDVEPNIGEAVLTTSELARISPQVRTAHIVFGVAVTCNLYRALQAAQGLTPSSCANNPPLENPANIPSLTSSQIRGIFSGRISNWTQLHFNGTDLVAAAVAAGEPAPNNAANPTDDAGGPLDNDIYVCRRVNSSGTQAAFESYWLNQRCDAIRGNGQSPTFVIPNDGSSQTVGAAPNTAIGGGRVNGSEASSDIRACMAYHVDIDGAGTDAGNGTWAVGTISTEVSSSNINAGQFRMVRVDGFAPNLANTANGDYTFFSEGTGIRLRSAFGGINPPTGQVLGVLQFIESNLGRESLIANINNGFQNRPWGDGGLLGIHGLYGNVAATRTQANGELSSVVGSVRDNPVNTMSRAVNSNRTNNCYPPIMVRPSPIN